MLPFFRAGLPKRCQKLHETFVYWLNGAAPLAALLRDSRPGFFAAVRRTVQLILAEFSPAGGSTRFLAAYDDQPTPRADVWSSFRLMSALAQWADAVPDDGARVDAAVDGWLRELTGYLDARGGLGPGSGSAGPANQVGSSARRLLG